MIISANQPYFIPYFPYWQLIHAADLFLMGDDYSFIKHGWVNRNRILFNGKVIFIRINLSGMRHGVLINKAKMMEPDVKRMFKILYEAYHNERYYEEGRALMERIMNYPERNLARFLEHSIREVCAYLGITTPLSTTSNLEGNSAFKREKRIYDFCHRLGADHYVNAVSGAEIYNARDFEENGIKLSFIHSHVAEHHPDDITFSNGLSIIDAIMRHSPEQLHEMLDDYSLVDGIETNDSPACD